MSSVGVGSTDLSIKQFSTFLAKIPNISCHIENDFTFDRKVQFKKFLVF